jgi:DNA (cytosine-5)-methyltransferase 1
MAWQLLDVCCCQGGASWGYHLAGFDVTGVDIEPQPRYPFPFVQADGLDVLADKAFMARFDAVHASWPCQRYTKGAANPAAHPDLIPPGRRALQATGLPWVMENVPSRRHDLRPDLKLCGCMFPQLGQLRRERWLETSWHAWDMRPPCAHTGGAVTVLTHGARREISRALRQAGQPHHVHVPDSEAAALMGVDWMDTYGRGEAIPPAYTQYVGGLLAAHLAEEAAS